jgi:hypothetical protein
VMETTLVSPKTQVGGHARYAANRS